MKSQQHSTNDSTPPQSRVAALFERWSLSLLMLGLITLSGTVVSLAWDGENVWRFALIAALGGAISAVLARSSVLDGFAMFAAMILGVATIWLITAGFSGILAGGLWDRMRILPGLLGDALIRDDMSGINRDLTADTLLSLTIWMSSWIAMWMLIRVGYVMLALVPPVVLILANEYFTNPDRAWTMVLMVALCILVIVRQRIRSQYHNWQLQGVQVADSIVGKVFVSGLAIAVAVSSTLLMSPAAWSESVLEPLISGTITRFEAVRMEAEFWFDEVLGTDLAPTRMDRYTEFSDGFSVGGPLSLTDEPEALAQVNSASAPYLTARSYDHYTGRGWTSSAAGEFAEGNQSMRQSPELLYNPNWEVALSTDARNQRASTAATITMLGPGSNVVLSVDSFLTADVQTVVRMSWTTVREAPFAISPETLNQLPPDVQLVGKLLLQSQLSGEQSAWGPTAVSADMQAAIEEEVDDLARRGIEVQWVATADGIVQTLYVTGRLPVFDDVDAVFRRQEGPTASSSYTVRGLTSIATAQQLEAASDDFPAWVTDRYLPTGDSVTDRTKQITLDIVGEETNPYRQAVLIESWLRTNITYDENVEAPPANQDLVDYVLFDNRRGYCEHYAAAMAVMLRTLGVPSRVVVGYSPGQVDPATGSWLYLQSNAHAWVEAYFPGYGWIPFEPTASQPLGDFDVEPGDGDAEAASETTPTPESVVPTLAVSTPDTAEDNSGATPQPTEADTTLAPPTVLPEEPESGPARWLLPVAGVGAVMTAAAAGIWLLWHRALRNLPPAAALMRRVQRVGGWLGIRSKNTTTPREYARQFEESANVLSGPVKKITRAYEIETFGPRAAREQVQEEARKAWRDIRSKAIYLLRHRRR